MSLWNTRDNYGNIAKALHWLTVFLFLGVYAAYYYRHWFVAKGEPLRDTLIHLHAAFGVTIFVFLILRVLWRVLNVTPDEAPGSPLEHLAARAAHGLLYLAMFAMPLTGWLFYKGDIPVFGLFDLPSFQTSGLAASFGVTDFDAFRAPIKEIHEISGSTWIWVLIVIHAAAAVWHHVVRKDNVLTRMSFR